MKLLTVSLEAVSFSMNTCAAALARIVKLGEMEAYKAGTSSVVVAGTVGKSAYSEAVTYAQLIAQGSGKLWADAQVPAAIVNATPTEPVTEPEATDTPTEPTIPLTVKERAAAARAAGLVKPQEPEAVVVPEPEAAPKKPRRSRKLAA